MVSTLELGVWLSVIISAGLGLLAVILSLYAIAAMRSAERRAVKRSGALEKEVLDGLERAVSSLAQAFGETLTDPEFAGVLGAAVFENAKMREGKSANARGGAPIADLDLEGIEGIPDNLKGLAKLAGRFGGGKAEPTPEKGRNGPPAW